MYWTLSSINVTYVHSVRAWRAWHGFPGTKWESEKISLVQNVNLIKPGSSSFYHWIIETAYLSKYRLKKITRIRFGKKQKYLFGRIAPAFPWLTYVLRKPASLENRYRYRRAVWTDVFGKYIPIRKYMICYGKAVAAPTKKCLRICIQNGTVFTGTKWESENISLVQNVNLIKPRKQFFLPLDHWNIVFI